MTRRQPDEQGIRIEARMMQEELPHSHASPAPRPEFPREVTAPAGGLLLPAEETWKKVRELTLRQLDRFMSYEAKVLKGNNADAIHDMRVASRRLQQVLDLVYAKPRPPELRRLRRQIRRCRQALGDVRNCDVLLELVRRPLARKRSARREAWAAIEHFLLLRRSENFLRAMRKLGKINLAVFYVNLKQFLHHDKAHEHAAQHHAYSGSAARPGFARDLKQALDSVWSRFQEQIERSHSSSRPEVIHAARIATKRLRYLVEVFHEFGTPGSADALAWLRQLQNHLGNWHDLEVLEQMMIQMLARPEFLREQLPLAMEVERLILRNRKNKAEFEQKYSHQLLGSSEMRRLKEWTANVLAPSVAASAKA
jgi:CHAD domain-containing protein